MESFRRLQDVTELLQQSCKLIDARNKITLRKLTRLIR